MASIIARQLVLLGLPIHLVKVGGEAKNKIFCQA